MLGDDVFDRNLHDSTRRFVRRGQQDFDGGRTARGDVSRVEAVAVLGVYSERVRHCSCVIGARGVVLESILETPRASGWLRPGSQVKRRRRSELRTTETEEKAIAPAAIIGSRSPNAATGTAATL